MVCAKCGKEIRENAKFCTGCGTPVKTRDAEKAGGAVQEEAAREETVQVEAAQEETVQDDAGFVQGETEPAPCETAVPESCELRSKAPWSPVIMGASAAVVASIIVAAAYFGVICPRTYSPVTFGAAVQESQESLSESAAPKHAFYYFIKKADGNSHAL